MMNIIKFFPMIILVLIAFYAGFTFDVHKRQQMIERQLELVNYASWATDVKCKVKLLSLIEEKRYDDARNFTDNLLDVTLANLSLYDKLAPIYPNQEIFDAIATAKKYRADHPGHKVHPMLSNSVERAFKIDKSKR